jgi:hypothetical protein
MPGDGEGAADHLRWALPPEEATSDWPRRAVSACAATPRRCLPTVVPAVALPIEPASARLSQESRQFSAEFAHCSLERCQLRNDRPKPAEKVRAFVIPENLALIQSVLDHVSALIDAGGIDDRGPTGLIVYMLRKSPQVPQRTFAGWSADPNAGR